MMLWLGLGEAIDYPGLKCPNNSPVGRLVALESHREDGCLDLSAW